MSSRMYLHESASREAGRPVLVMSQAPGPSLTLLERVDLATSTGRCSCTVPTSGAAESECSCTSALSEDDRAWLGRILAQLAGRHWTEPATVASPSPVTRLSESVSTDHPPAEDAQAQLARLAESMVAAQGVTLSEAYRSISLAQPDLYYRARDAATLPDTLRGLH